MVLTLAVSGAVIAALVRRRAGRQSMRVALVTGLLIVAAVGAWRHGEKSAATAAAFHREPLFDARLLHRDGAVAIWTLSGLAK